MKVLLQRVTTASVSVDGEVVGKIERGLLLFVGFAKNDDEAMLAPMAEKVVNLRVFPDQDGRFHYSVSDIEGGVLVVPQFTLYADTQKGRRPEFFSAMEPKAAELFFEKFISFFSPIKVQTGRFGANMQVSLVNDGPVTIMLER